MSKVYNKKNKKKKIFAPKWVLAHWERLDLMMAGKQQRRCFPVWKQDELILSKTTKKFPGS